MICVKETSKKRKIYGISKFLFIKKDGVYVNGKLIGEFGSYLGYKIIELCPTCADSFARCIEEQMKELGMEI